MKSSRVVIPTKLSRPRQNMNDYTYLLYGERKIGKTSMLASAKDKALFLMFEEGTKALKTRELSMKNWDYFVKTVEALEDDPKGVEFVVIDTAEICYRFCEKFICKDMGIKDPGQVSHGKAWKRIRWEFHDTMLRLAKTGLGIWFISHATEKEIEPEDDATYIKIIPNLSKQAGEIIGDSVDVIAYYRYGKKGRREIVIRGNQKLEAGCRLEENFTGIKRIPAGASAREAWKNVRAAFNNESGEKTKVKIKRRRDG